MAHILHSICSSCEAYSPCPQPFLTLQMYLDVFKEDPQFREHEAEYAAIKREILGEESEEEQVGGAARARAPQAGGRWLACAGFVGME